MRLLPGLTLLALCLSLVGCGLPPRNRDNNSRAGTGQPFMGLPETRTATADTSEPPSSKLTSKQGKTKASGLLAGSVIDPSRRRVAGATVQIKEDGPSDGAAPLTARTDKDGWFNIAGFEAGRWYRLVARARDGSRYLTGSTRVQCPSVRVAIALTGEENIPEPTPPGESASKAESRTEPSEKPSASSASRVTPIFPPLTEGSTTPLPSDEPRPAPAPVPTAPAEAVPATPYSPPPRITRPAPGTDPSLIAGQRGSKTGFDYAPPPPVVAIPGRSDAQKRPITPYSPPPPPSGDDVALPPSTAPSAAPLPASPSPVVPDSDRSEAAAPPPVVVPSCVRTDRVEDFALYDVNDKVWELRKNRKGKLMLLDFWYTKCDHCLTALPFVSRLDQKYRHAGLDVVGIANEEGTFLKKQGAVLQVRKRYGISYPLLFAGGGTGDCPVIKQLEIVNYPTVILLDDSGKIVWRVSGLDDNGKYALEMAIRRHLGLPAR